MRCRFRDLFCLESGFHLNLVNILLLVFLLQMDSFFLLYEFVFDLIHLISVQTGFSFSVLFLTWIKTKYGFLYTHCCKWVLKLMGFVLFPSFIDIYIFVAMWCNECRISRPSWLGDGYDGNWIYRKMSTLLFSLVWGFFFSPFFSFVRSTWLVDGNINWFFHVWSLFQS